METFPDYIVVDPEGTTIKVDQIHALKVTINQNSNGIECNYLCDSCGDTLTPGAANSLLKFFRRTDRKHSLYFIDGQLSKVLITIQSRCQNYQVSIESRGHSEWPFKGKKRGL